MSSMEEIEEAFQEVCKEVTKGMVERKTKLRPVLEELEATLISLRDDTLQSEDQSHTPKSLLGILREGAKLIAEVSKIRSLRRDLDDYKEKVINFDESLRHSHHLLKKKRAEKSRTGPLTEEEHLREHLREEFVAAHSAHRVFLRMKEDKKEPGKIKNLLKIIEEETSHCVEIMDLMTTEELRSLAEEMRMWVGVVWTRRHNKTKDQCDALERLRLCLCHNCGHIVSTV